jgi:polyphosphate kinase 2 (PPK2 family)
MLENVNLTQTLSKADYDGVFTGLERALPGLQMRARALCIPVIILFEGWDASGKGTLINKLLLCLDPRGFKVHPINPPTEEERRRPFLWRFWIRTPARGTIAIFDRSWYGRVLVERVDGLVGEDVWSKSYDEIRSFERQLVDGGVVLIKFFLHIDKKEQKRRFRKLEANPATSWKVTKTDWMHHDHYKKWLAAVEETLLKTDSGFAPWTIVEAHDRRFATVKVFRTVIETLERRIREAENEGARAGHPVPAAAKTESGGGSPSSARERERALQAGPADGAPTPPSCGQASDGQTSVLDKVDLTLSLTEKEYTSALERYQRRIMELEHEIYVRRIPVIIVFQGWDAAGKGGAIKRLVQGMDPRGYDVIPVGPPNELEKAHHYLWRFWINVPKTGHFAVFDRSWYGRVLVERVEGFCTEEEWRRAYGEINEMEEQFATFGACIMKFWLHIDKDEQLRRFKAREEEPHKRWKITQEDWNNREKWDAYKVAVDEMLWRTSTPHAPWTIVEANSKWYARVKVLKTVVGGLEKRLK